MAAINEVFAPMGRSNKKSGFFRSRFSTNVSTWFLAP
jgi:hypothetical protein